MNALTPIIERTRAEVARRRAVVGLDEIHTRAAARVAQDPRRSFAASLRGGGVSVIAEHKRRSPSAGTIREGVSLEDVVGAYERGGAAALSILTEEHSFGGSLADLEHARALTALPLLCKDFVVDPYQVPESAVAGADAILLIVAAVEPDLLRELFDLARGIGLDALVEVHNSAELDRAIALGAEIIGINNRDLTTLRVDTERVYGLLPDVPQGAVVVAESGFRTRAELERLAGAGVDAVLVGEALMRARDIEFGCRELTGAAARAV
jgi:indole-3-glycerol phosphate synthase